MQVFQDINPIRQFLKSARDRGHTIGFVPTMGALHKGHMSLIDASKNVNDITVCSIYINPTQFNNPSDLAKYPRMINADKNMLENAGCEVLFIPDDQIMYPGNQVVTMSFGYLEDIMEGKFRPGHFKGVGAVVAKLFHIVQPDNAYFGQKDFQQFMIIQQMVRDFFFDIHLNCMPIVREPDGLAMSSRNTRLSKEQRRKAPVIYQSLSMAGKNLSKGMSIAKVRKDIALLMEKNDIRLEYFEVVDSNTLKPLGNITKEGKVALCIAAYLGEIRLIDNLLLF